MARGPNNYPVDLHRLSVTEDTPARLERVAQAMDRSQAWVRRTALDEYLTAREAELGLTRANTP